MKIRRSILWFVTLVALLMVLLIWFVKKPAEMPLPTAAATNAMPSPTAEEAIKPNQRGASPARRTNVLTPPAVASPNVPAPLTQTKAAQMKEGLATLNDENVVLYGKVIDQFDSPVANANITGSIQINNGTQVGTRRISINTDVNGSFKIDGYKGKALGINISKAGYALATTNTRFVYSLLWPEAERHIPDPNKPVLFKMWRLQGQEPLVPINQEYKLPFTGTPLFFDFTTGKVSDSGGDLEVIITRAPGPLSKRNPSDWSIDFKPVNGGILESDDAASRVIYEAPAEGYQSSYPVQMNHENPAWFDNIQKVFFLKSRGGQVYSKFSVEFGINDEPSASMWFQFRGVANANGSRNWEATADTTKPQ